MGRVARARFCLQGTAARAFATRRARAALHAHAPGARGLGAHNRCVSIRPVMVDGAQI